MAALAAMPAWAPGVLIGGGALLGMGGAGAEAAGAQAAGASARAAGAAKRAASEFEAKQLEVQAGDAIAASQRDAMEQKRHATLVQSRALALAAAGGGGASDPTVVNIMSKITGEGAYRQAVALYQGEDKARLLRMGAAGKRYEGQVAETLGVASEESYKRTAQAANLKGLGAGLQGAGSLMRYWPKGGFPGTGGTAGGGESALIMDAGIDPAMMAAMA